MEGRYKKYEYIVVYKIINNTTRQLTTRYLYSVAHGNVIYTTIMEATQYILTTVREGVATLSQWCCYHSKIPD